MPKSMHLEYNYSNIVHIPDISWYIATFDQLYKETIEISKFSKFQEFYDRSSRNLTQVPERYDHVSSPSGSIIRHNIVLFTLRHSPG